MNIEEQYLELLKDISTNGVKKGDRTGVGTLSVYGRQLRHKMSTGFPLLTTKKMYWKGIVTELLWFLRGETNIKFLIDNDCHIWNGDAYKSYLKVGTERTEKAGQTWTPLTQKEFIDLIKTDDEFAEKWGELGPIYGKQWRAWGEERRIDLDTSVISRIENGIEKHPYKEFTSKRGIDQIQNLINDLKTNPDSRRLIVTAWNPQEISRMVLPPCHYGFQIWTRELSWEEQVEWVLKNTGVELENLYIVEEIAKSSTPKKAISLMWNQRSVDVLLGLPFNIASYAVLLSIIGEVTNMVPDELIANLGDTHIYLNHLDAVEEQLTRKPCQPPLLRINTEFWPTASGECGVGPLHSDIGFLIDNMQIEDFQIEAYTSHPPIKAQLNN